MGGRKIEEMRSPRVAVYEMARHSILSTTGASPQSRSRLYRCRSFGDERVHDHVAEVDEDPPAFAVALDADRRAPGGFRALDDAIGDRLDLPLSAAAAQDEEVRDRRDLGHVHDEDVLGLLVGRRFDDQVGERARAQVVRDVDPSVR